MRLGWRLADPTFIGGGIDLADTEAAVGSEGASFRFDYRNQHAVQYAEEVAAQLVTRVSEETRLALRELIVQGLRDGIPPRKLMRMIMDSVGLNAQQAAALANYRTALEAEEGLSEANVDKAVAKYGQRLLKARKLMIARTETMRFVNAGKLESALQAQAQGYLDQGAVKEWLAAPEELEPPVCPICSGLNGMQVPLFGAFPIGRESASSSSSSVTAVLAPPAHPYCRCTIKILPRRTKPAR